MSTLNPTSVDLDEAALKKAADEYPWRVTGPYSGCRNPAELLRWCLDRTGSPESRLAERYVRTLHGACWNAMIGAMPADGWLVWYKKKDTKEKA